MLYLKKQAAQAACWKIKCLKKLIFCFKKEFNNRSKW